LTNVARASLEELRLDYEDFLRQRGLEMLPPNHPVLMRFKQKRCASLECVRDWVAEERARQLKVYQESLTQTNTDYQGRTQTTDNEHHGQTRRPCQSVPVRVSPCSAQPQPQPHGQRPPLRSSELAANAALSLLNLACYFLDRQIAFQAESFKKEGGFTERLYRKRIQARTHH
jgi:four helix bundle suffix protein